MFNINGKKGMMDDFFDLLFTSIALLFLFLFVSSILNTDVETKKEATIAHLDSYQNDAALLHFLNYPSSIGERAATMKAVLLAAANVNKNDLFQGKVREYFEKNNLEGGVAVYDSAAYAQGKEPLFSYSNVVFGGGTKSEAVISNDAWKEIPSITVVLFT